MGKPVLAIRTESPTAKVLLVDELGKILGSDEWGAHRTLSDTLLKKIQSLLQEKQSEWNAIGGIIIYAGPGSFTGIRIGATVAATLAYSLDVPIASKTGDTWIEDGLIALKEQPENRAIKLDYGGEANITTPKK